jgi:hypothetical protein
MINYPCIACRLARSCSAWQLPGLRQLPPTMQSHWQRGQRRPVLPSTLLASKQMFSRHMTPSEWSSELDCCAVKLASLMDLLGNT